MALSIAALVLSGGSLPHIHASNHPGLHNQEHDLGYFATLGALGPMPDTAAIAPLALAGLLGIRQMPTAPAVAAKRHANFRAPPVR